MPPMIEESPYTVATAWSFPTVVSRRAPAYSTSNSVVLAASGAKSRREESSRKLLSTSSTRVSTDKAWVLYCRVLFVSYATGQTKKNNPNGA